MKELLYKMWAWRWALRSLPWTILFNFHYLPFKQAIRLPFVFYKPTFGSLKGSVTISCEKIRFGMVVMGRFDVRSFPNTGIRFENWGGELIIDGQVVIGNNSTVIINKTGFVRLGDKVFATTSLTLLSYVGIYIFQNTRLGWDITIMDTDFHKLSYKDGTTSKGFAPISIGSNCWLGNGVLIMKGTQIPNYTVVSARSIISGKYDIPSYCVIGMENKVVVRKQNVYWDIDNDNIDYKIN